MNLIETWKKYKPKRPYVLPVDREYFSRDKGSNYDWKRQIKRSDFLDPENNLFHLGLLPHPFMGNLRKASIYILLLNPGFGPGDYYAEYQVPAFKKALLANLKQTREASFFSLEPRFAWTGGFMWWHSKLEKVIKHLSKKVWKVSYAKARRRLAKHLASIELIPYHSRSSNRLPKDLPSTILAKNFVKNLIERKVKKKKAIIIATRQIKAWELPKHPGVIKYSSGEARGAHMTPNTKGGRAIIKFLSS